jgi:hypothetical protein
MPVRLTKGTKENVEVQVQDWTNTVTDLSTASPHFDVKKDDGTAVVTNQAATATGMIVHCLCDTTSWPSEPHLNLFVSFTVGSEVPRLGPFDIYMVG